MPPAIPDIWTAENTGRVPFRERDEGLDRSASGPFWLRDPGIADMVEDALLYGEATRRFYTLHGWVIMPNHVHVVLEPHTPLPTIMRWLKGRTGRQANRRLGRSGVPS